MTKVVRIQASTQKEWKMVKEKETEVKDQSGESEYVTVDLKQIGIVAGVGTVCAETALWGGKKVINHFFQKRQTDETARALSGKTKSWSRKGFRI